MAKWIEKDERFANYLSDGWNGVEGAGSAGLVCVCCGRRLVVGAHTSDPACATLDHIAARASTGLKYDKRNFNLVSMCVGCNSSRRDMTMQDFLASRFDAAGVVAAWARIGERVARKLDASAWAMYRAQGKALAPKRTA